MYTIAQKYKTSSKNFYIKILFILKIDLLLNYFIKNIDL